jgi:hypothetical protein
VKKQTCCATLFLHRSGDEEGRCFSKIVLRRAKSSLPPMGQRVSTCDLLTTYMKERTAEAKQSREEDKRSDKLNQAQVHVPPSCNNWRAVQVQLATYTIHEFHRPLNARTKDCGRICKKLESVTLLLDIGLEPLSRLGVQAQQIFRFSCTKRAKPQSPRIPLPAMGPTLHSARPMSCFHARY